jgi:hypothetical protein
MFNKKNIRALENFIQNIYSAESLSSEESEKNLEDSLFEIFYYNGQHKANGLFITENGYFLTANHAAEDTCLDYVLYNKRIYPIKFIHKRDKKKDISLGKVDLPKKPKNLIYKIENTNLLLKEYPFGYPSTIIYKKDGKINKIQTKIWTTGMGTKLKNSEKYESRIITDTFTEDGTSGGIILNWSGKLIGILSSGNDCTTLFSPIFSGLNLIQKEINTLKSPIIFLEERLF